MTALPTPDWISRCAARMLELDPSLDPGDVLGIVQALAEVPRWRELAPEVAADLTFNEPSLPPAHRDVQAAILATR